MDQRSCPGIFENMATNLAILSTKSLRPFTARLRDYYDLTKPEVNLLILISTSAGYALGNEGEFGWWKLLHTLLGTLAVASGTATLNQFMERRHDAEMRRTAGRPLPAGRIRAREALWFGVLLSVVGFSYLLFAVNALSAIVAALTLLSYLLIYTPLKRKTPLCTLLGAVPGSMPILIGWCAASTTLDLRAGLLFSLLFLWQFPHFLAIALMYREDYERAEYRMLPAFDEDGRFTRVEICLFALAVILVTVACVSLYGGSAAAIMGMVGLGGFLLYSSVKLALARSKAAASRLLHATVIYLPAVLAILVWQRY
jgi:heme o synthase